MNMIVEILESDDPDQPWYATVSDIINGQVLFVSETYVRHKDCLATAMRLEPVAVIDDSVFEKRR